ncbi:MAG: hypothetical protein JXB15_05060 [Anaerolineales bacterium]|nr:hypothetical protein [Anaerolineales bacterium]
MRRIRNLVLILANGYLLVYFSELMFWSRPRPEDSLVNWLITWLVYSLLGVVLLAAVAHFRVRSLWALFLCGAMFGWLTEGVIVQTMYDVFPLQISWTGLAWHAAISVMLGWYGLRRVLLANRPWYTFLASCGLGLFLGIWSIFWWVEEPGHIASVNSFAVFVSISTLLLVASYVLCNWALQITPLEFPNWIAILSLAFLALIFFLEVVPERIWAVLVLPPLMAGLYFTLQRNRQCERGVSIFSEIAGKIPPIQYLILLAAPLVASAFYALAAHIQIRLFTGWLVYALATPAGFIILGLSIYKIWRRPVPPPAPESEIIFDEGN